MSRRALSHSEVSTLLDCQLKHAFNYTGTLTGGLALKPRSIHVNLRAGRAWGAGVAEWNSTGGNLLAGKVAMHTSLNLDADQLRYHGWYDHEEHEQLRADLDAMLDHYASVVTPLPIHTQEHEIRVPIRSRNSDRASSVYDFHGFLDGVYCDDHGRDWIIEFKLRKRLSSLDDISRGRQLRWYAWAWLQQTGRPIAGVVLDERLNAVPAPVRFNKDGSVSRTQSCPVDAYTDACLDRGQEPEPEVAAKLMQKRWQARHTVFLTDRDVEEAGEQMRSAARLVRELESGRMEPIRNPNPMRCPGCAFRDICLDRTDDLIDALFERVPPKSQRPIQEEAA